MNKIYIVYYEDLDIEPVFVCCTRTKEMAIEKANKFAIDSYYPTESFVIEYDVSKECFVREFTDGAEICRFKGHR
jgi:hypothetical protein